MDEADDRYLADIAADCEGLLGPGMTMLGVEREDRGEGVRLVATYRLGELAGVTTVDAETVVAAHAALRARLLSDRIRLGFSLLVEPEGSIRARRAQRERHVAGPAVR